MYAVEFTTEALEDLRLFKKFEQKQVVEAIETQLKHEPIIETRNRKKLRPNGLAEWELRVGKFRVFYDVDRKRNFVKIEAVGYKQDNRIFIRGEEYDL